MDPHCPDRSGAWRRLLGGAALAALLAPAHAVTFGWSTFAGADGAHLDAANDAPVTHVLRVCADPDALPASRRDGSGFENRIAALMARSLGAKLEMVWTPPQRGWVRKTLGAGRCDAVMGVPAGFAPLLTTRPYYRSSWVFVERAGAAPLAGLDDPRLAGWRIGVPLLGGDAQAQPPAVTVARAGAVDNVVGFPLYGDGTPAARMVDALAAGRLDAALLWGPQAGWYARHASPPLQLEPVAATPPKGFAFSMAMGVPRGHAMLRAALDRAIEQHRGEIDAILADFDVPRLDLDAERVARTRP